ncbi:MAG TPA: DUF4846 domain-containing protein [Chitinophagaceae bacterium]|nr:DUF4846 domain-containing protein [Chitinophagaceae bacterium]
MRNATIFFLLFLPACGADGTGPFSTATARTNSYKTIGEIPPPEGFQHTGEPESSFAFWLRQRPLKKDKTVYLYNGRPKPNQQAQYAVLDVSVGDKDLQQCADAVIRLRAEYLYEQQRWDDISFLASNGQSLSFIKWQAGERYRLKGNRLEPYRVPVAGQSRQKLFDAYLEFVFMYAGTLSLPQQLRKVPDFADIKAGDVLLKGGAPGHAMLVVDVVVNEMGDKKYLLAQSYMPAQNIHVVKNPAKGNGDPWYDAEGAGSVITPEWEFEKSQLYRW